MSGWSEGEISSWSDGEMGGWSEREMSSWSEGEMSRWSEGEMSSGIIISGIVVFPLNYQWRFFFTELA